MSNARFGRGKTAIYTVRQKAALQKSHIFHEITNTNLRRRRKTVTFGVREKLFLTQL